MAGRQAAVNKSRSWVNDFGATCFPPAFPCSAREDLSSLLESLRNPIDDREDRTNIPRLKCLSMDGMFEPKIVLTHRCKAEPAGALYFLYDIEKKNAYEFWMDLLEPLAYFEIVPLEITHLVSYFRHDLFQREYQEQ